MPEPIIFNTKYNIPNVANFYFGTTQSGTIQVNILDRYINSTTPAGTSIIFLRNLNRTKLYVHTIVESGITSSNINDKYIFIGTTYTGIEYVCTNKVDSNYDNIDLTYSTYNFACNDDITSNNVKYIHCNENYVMCCTESGIDWYDVTTTSGYHYYEIFSGAKKCFITDTNAYYTLASGSYEAVIVVKDFNNTYNYLTFSNDPVSGTFASGISINDLFIDYTTSGTNTIYCATTSGIYAINEDTGYYDVYLTVSG